MDMLKKFFPFSFRTKENDIASLVIAILIHIVVGVVVGWVLGLLSLIPLLGLIFSLISTLVGLYLLAGIVIMLLNYFKVLK